MKPYAFYLIISSWSLLCNQGFSYCEITVLHRAYNPVICNHDPFDDISCEAEADSLAEELAQVDPRFYFKKFTETYGGTYGSPAETYPRCAQYHSLKTLDNYRKRYENDLKKEENRKAKEQHKKKK